MENLTKVCSKCGIEKPLKVEFFYKRYKGSLDGFRGSCRQCDDFRKNEWRQQNKDLTNLYERERYNKYYKAKKQELNRRWQTSNKDRFKEYLKYYQNIHRDRINEKNRASIILLSNWYVKLCVRNDSKGALKSKYISKDIIELKRNSILLKRIINQKLEENESTTNV